MEKAKKVLKKRLTIGCGLFALLVAVLAVFGGGMLAKNALPAFLFLLGLAVGVVAGFLATTTFIAYTGMNEELKRNAVEAVKTAGSKPS